MDALRQGGILAVTVWNKEDPPKSTLKLMTTIVKAAEEARKGSAADDLFMAHTYLSTLSVLYKKGGFRPEELRELDGYCRKMSFEIIWPPEDGGAVGDDIDRVLEAYRGVYFAPRTDGGPDEGRQAAVQGAKEGELSSGEGISQNASATDSAGEGPESESSPAGDLSAGRLYRLVADRLVHGDLKKITDGYVFNTDYLTNDRPYFAGFVKVRDIPEFLDKLETVSDEWGYLLLWATLLVSTVLGFLLLAIPMVFGWKAFFGKHRGKLSIVIYFLCLGLGYIIVEIGLIGKYLQCLGNATVSVAVLITGMLLFSGVGSYVSARCVPKAGKTIIAVCCGITAVLLLYAYSLDSLLTLVGMAPYGVKVLACLALLFPPAFLMGFPFALGMSTLSELGKEEFFVWAWGINGSFSVVGSAMAPLLAVSFGLSSTLFVSAAAYLAALVSFRGLQSRDASPAAR